MLQGIGYGYGRKDMASELYVDWDRRRRDPDYNPSRDDGLLPRPVLMLDIQENYTVANADALLAGHVWDGYNTCDVAQTGIDWRQGTLPCITRFSVLGAMRHAMAETGDAKYARWAVDHIAEYIDAWPIEQFIGILPKKRI